MVEATRLLQVAARPVDTEDEDTREYKKPHSLTAEQQEALYYARKRRKLRQGFYSS